MQKEASYTVEMALLLPILLLALLLPIYTGFRLYERTKEVSAYSKTEYAMEEHIRRIRQINEVREE